MRIIFISAWRLCAQVSVSGPDLSYAASKAIPAVVRIQAFLSDSLLNVHTGLVMVMNIKPGF